MKEIGLLGVSVVLVGMLILAFASLFASPTNPLMPDLGQTLRQIEQGSFASGNASASEIVIQWDSMPISLGENVWFSTKHPESAGIISSLNGLAANNNGRIERKGEDPKSSGSIRIYAGTSGDMVHFSILKVSGHHLAYAVVSAPLKHAGSACVGGGCEHLYDDVFIDPQQLVWTCAWMLSDRIVNGHGTQGKFLVVGEGWLRWKQIQSRYNLVIEVASLPLPPSPFK